MAVEQVARWPWNAWPDERGLGGRMAWNPHKDGKTKRRKGTSIKSTDILIAPPQRPIFFIPPLNKYNSEG